MAKIALPDLAAELRQGYGRTREMAFRGRYGELVREAGRWFVVRPDPEDAGTGSEGQS